MLDVVAKQVQFASVEKGAFPAAVCAHSNVMWWAACLRRLQCSSGGMSAHTLSGSSSGSSSSSCCSSSASPHSCAACCQHLWLAYELLNMLRNRYMAYVSPLRPIWACKKRVYAAVYGRLQRLRRSIRRIRVDFLRIKYGGRYMPLYTDFQPRRKNARIKRMRFCTYICTYTLANILTHNTPDT
jgi:hypothetical protein